MIKTEQEVLSKAVFDFSTALYEAGFILNDVVIKRLPSPKEAFRKHTVITPFSNVTVTEAVKPDE